MLCMSRLPLLTPEGGALAEIPVPIAVYLRFWNIQSPQQFSCEREEFAAHCHCKLSSSRESDARLDIIVEEILQRTPG